MKFTEFNFNENIQKGIESAGFKECMPVQEQTFQTILENKDVFAQSQTGTGKTAAFLISIFQLLGEDKHFKGQKALIICPTRELVVQIEEEAKVLGQHLDFRIGSFYGGVGYNEQEQSLADGCDILIGTPGRLIDFSKSGKIRFSEMGILVIDEADRLFDMGFLPDLRKILSKMPAADMRRTMLFSATLNAKVGNLAWEYMNNPGEIVIEPEQLAVEAITQELYHVSAEEKMKLLLGVMKRDKPDTAIIFANTKHTTYEVAKRLEHNGYHAKCLMGDLPQKKRLKIVEEAKEGKTPFLVATDVAARGLHINDLSLVVNYDVPTDAESYVHRIGRTARAGKTGKAITLACEKFVYGLPAIEKLTGQKIPVSWADEDLMVEDKSEGMRFHFDKRAGASGDHQGRRDGRGRPRNGGGVSRKYSGGNKRPLDARAARVQSAVLAVSGTMDSVDEEIKKSNTHNGSEKQSISRNRKRKNSYKGQKPTDNRSRNRGENKAPASLPMERVSSKNSIEDRLAYYKAKYGEDFQADKGTIKSFKGGSKSGNGGNRKRSGRPVAQRSGNKGPVNNSHANKGATNKNSSSKTSQNPKSARPVNQVKEKAPVQKKGLLSRLFGKK
ncbi:DEAD/DEAH box helicase [Oceanispirochaeta crateris]|uniref:DEAD/DEAH box helicase n=1 Tax=Oceanispirochaeta crateris TaxID=2518645 RepID=A0A5C1QIU0_9SPIO|nr:DEAD/DEAH box helicase [Oceanispirochaeta crateris]QEN08073.1 DEAD/DEAH box helicase [Oceanispirochaeta crateris]